jgi:hypothetical protein
MLASDEQQAPSVGRGRRLLRLQWRSARTVARSARSRAVAAIRAQRRDPVPRPTGREAGTGLACVPVPLLPQGQAADRAGLVLSHTRRGLQELREQAPPLVWGDVDERRRSSDPHLRQAIARSTSWWLTVRYGKRGCTRAIPLDEDALGAIAAWVKVRPAAGTEHLLLSLPRTGQPPRAMSTRDVARIVARYGRAAGVPEDRRTPHVLRHTFCTHLADSGADVGVIRELAGHADIRTTTIYTAVNDERLEDAIAERRRVRRRLDRLANQ